MIVQEYAKMIISDTIGLNESNDYFLYLSKEKINSIVDYELSIRIDDNEIYNIIPRYGGKFDRI